MAKIFDHLNKLKFSTVQPTAYTERGLYMLATILKSERAARTTITIIDTFTKVREIARTMEDLQNIDSDVSEVSNSSAFNPMTELPFSFNRGLQTATE